MVGIGVGIAAAVWGGVIWFAVREETSTRLSCVDGQVCTEYFSLKDGRTVLHEAVRRGLVKAGTWLLQKGANATVQLSAPGGWSRDAGQQLEERALASAIAANDSEDFAMLYFERDIAQSPQLRVASGHRSTLQRTDRRLSEGHHCVPQCRICLPASTQTVPFSQMRDADGNLGHGRGRQSDDIREPILGLAEVAQSTSE